MFNKFSNIYLHRHFNLHFFYNKLTDKQANKINFNHSQDKLARKLIGVRVGVTNGNIMARIEHTFYFCCSYRSSLFLLLFSSEFCLFWVIFPSRPEREKRAKKFVKGFFFAGFYSPLLLVHIHGKTADVQRATILIAFT